MIRCCLLASGGWGGNCSSGWRQQRQQSPAASLTAALCLLLCCTYTHLINNRGALKNLKFTQSLVDVIKEAGLAATGCPKAKGNLLYTIASKVCICMYVAYVHVYGSSGSSLFVKQGL